jgi:hypothetical protein
VGARVGVRIYYTFASAVDECERLGIRISRAMPQLCCAVLCAVVWGAGRGRVYRGGDTVVWAVLSFATTCTRVGARGSVRVRVRVEAQIESLQLPAARR